jgi:protein-disulfide isomerase
MHDLLFENQRHLKPKGLRRFAEEAELDLERYDFEMNDQVYLQRVQEHIDGGTKSGVRSTPTFFVNGVLRDVSFGLERLRQSIETEIERLHRRP